MRMRALLVSASLALFACVGDSTPPIKPPPPPDPLPTATAVSDTTDVPLTPPAPPKPKLEELESTTLKGIVDAMGARDPKKVSDRYATGAVVTVYAQGELTGRDAISADVQAWLDGFSDFKMQIGRVLLRGDAAVVEWGISGTHSGDFNGVKATGRSLGALGVSVMWFDADGLVTKEHRLFDRATLIAQDDKRAKDGTYRAAPTLAEKIETHLSKGGVEEEKLVEIARRFQSSVSNKKESDALALLADDFVFDDLVQARTYSGTKDAKALFASLVKVLPDGKSTTTIALASDDLVALETDRTVSAKAGEKARIHLVFVVQIANGKIAKATRYASATELREQLHPPAVTPKKAR